MITNFIKSKYTSKVNNIFIVQESIVVETPKNSKVTTACYECWHLFFWGGGILSCYRLAPCTLWCNIGRACVYVVCTLAYTAILPPKDCSDLHNTDFWGTPATTPLGSVSYGVEVPFIRLVPGHSVDAPLLWDQGTLAVGSTAFCCILQATPE